MRGASGLLLAPGIVELKFSVDPVYNNLTSLYMLCLADSSSGFDEWVYRTAARLSREQMRIHRALIEILYSAFEPDQEWPDFPAYLQDLAQQDPGGMRARFFRHMFPGTNEREQRAVVRDLETLIAQIDRSEFDREIERDVFAAAHALLAEPAALQDTIVSHLTRMWESYLADEWERNLPRLKEAVALLRRSLSPEQNAYDAIRSITGRMVERHWQRVLARAETLVFIPSPHIGPYLSHVAYPPVVRVFFGPRLPEERDRAQAYAGRADFLVQLRTLADETRLRIVETLADEGELCAQDLVAHLHLTKSSASRHLSQLSAAGYLVEYQRAGKTKCYALNPERFAETIRVLERYARG